MSHPVFISSSFKRNRWRLYSCVFWLHLSLEGQRSSSHLQKYCDPKYTPRLVGFLQLGPDGRESLFRQTSSLALNMSDRLFRSHSLSRSFSFSHTQLRLNQDKQHICEIVIKLIRGVLLRGEGGIARCF